MEEITNLNIVGKTKRHLQRFAPTSFGKGKLSEQERAHRCLSEVGRPTPRIGIHSYLTARPECSSKAYHTYVISVNVDYKRSTLNWTICRRYSEFVALFKELCELSQHAHDKENQKEFKLPALPTKTSVFYHPGHQFLAKRGNGLSSWLNSTWKLVRSSESRETIAQFLTQDINERPSMVLQTHTIDIQDEEDDDEEERRVSDLSQHLRNSTWPGQTTKLSDRNVTHKSHRLPSLDQYQLVSVIGKGSFGQVLLAKRKRQHLPSNCGSNQEDLFAIKVLDKQEMARRKQVKRVLVERKCLEAVNSPFIVKLRAAFHTTDHVFLVQDYCAGGELYFRLETVRTLSVHAAKIYVAECTLALQHLHSLNIVYRDLKPENLMLDRQGHIRLVDFGLAKIGVKSSTSGAKSFVGTTEYLAPEMIGRKGHGFAVDWWALGMVLYEMLSGLPPWYSEDRKALVRGILHAPLVFKSIMSYQTRSLLSGLLERSPDMRLGSRGGAQELRNHPFFADINWSVAERRGLTPPYIPRLKDAADISCFDPSFTRLPNKIDPPTSKSTVKGSSSGTISKSMIATTRISGPSSTRNLPASAGILSPSPQDPDHELVEAMHISPTDQFDGFSFDGDL